MSPQEMLAQAKDLQSQYQAGKLSAKEFKELMGDLDIASNVLKRADEFEQNQEIREALIQLASIAQAVY